MCDHLNLYPYYIGFPLLIFWFLKNTAFSIVFRLQKKRKKKEFQVSGTEKSDKYSSYSGQSRRWFE